MGRRHHKPDKPHKAGVPSPASIGHTPSQEDPTPLIQQPSSAPMPIPPEGGADKPSVGPTDSASAQPIAAEMQDNSTAHPVNVVQAGEVQVASASELGQPPAPMQLHKPPVTQPGEARTEAAPEAPALCKPLPVPLSSWQVCGVAVAGLAHHRKGLPCQDAVAWHQKPRVVLALSDGAGSAAISERGAAALVRGMSRFVMSLEDAMAAWLDQACDQTSAQTAAWSRRLLAHAQGLLADLAQTERRSVRDLRATLLLAVMGTEHVFWWQVGDGTIVIQSINGLQALSSPSQTKGEFANQTCFVDVAKVTDVQCGLLTTAEVLGLALMSDGGAEKLVASDGSRVSMRLNSWFDDLASQALSAEKLAVAYHEPAMNERTTLDDRSVLLAARRPNP